MNYKRSCSAAGALLLALSLSACGTGEEAQKGGGESDGVVQFMTWESAETNQQLDKLIAEKWKNDDIKLERIDAPAGDYSKKLGSLAQAKELPDIFWCGNDTEQQFSQLGLLIDWTDKFESEFSKDDFDGLDRWTTENGLGGLPSLRNVYGVWYNADLFKEAGVDIPKPGWTWDDMYDAAKKLTGAGGSKYGLAADSLVTTDGPYTMSVYSVSAGGDPFVDDVNNPSKFTMDDKFLEGVTKLRDAIKAGSVTPPDYDQSNMASLFASGKQPMMIGGQWHAQSFLADAKSFEWGWVPMPSQGTPTATYDSIGMCTPNTAGADETFKAVAFLEKEILPQVMADSKVAPVAYAPGRDGYLKALEESGMTTVAETVNYNVDAEKLVGTRLTTSYASQVNDLTTATYLPVLKGQRPVEDLQGYVAEVEKLHQEQ